MFSAFGHDANHSLFYTPNIHILFLIYNYSSGCHEVVGKGIAKPAVRMYTLPFPYQIVCVFL
jgi:hypothetical protein